MNKLNSSQATPVTLFIPTFSPAFTRTIKPVSHFPIQQQVAGHLDVMFIC